MFNTPIVVSISSMLFTSANDFGKKKKMFITITICFGCVTKLAVSHFQAYVIPAFQANIDGYKIAKSKYELRMHRDKQLIEPFQ